MKLLNGLGTGRRGYRTVGWLAGAAAMLVCASRTPAAITADQVLVVYNSQSTDATAVMDAYAAAHPDIPAVNFFDLNAPVIANTADISYADFVTYIRNPIRAYLDVAGDPTPSGIVSICLIRGIPHRVQDTNNPTVGDDPNAEVTEINAGDVTCASVDSELVLLWQDLEAGEAGGNMDSKSDDLIDNPYHTSTSEIQTFSRANIKTAKTLTQLGLIWKFTTGGSASTRLTPGDMYLVSRIDGNTAADAIASITRAAHLHVNRRYARIILDEDARTNQLDDDDIYTAPSVFNAGPDYENTRDHMTTAGWSVLYDNTAAFYLPATVTRPVIAYASYGENHSPNPAGCGTYIQGFDFPPGAMFNTFESYNGRGFNGLGTLFCQEQVADFIAAGGTLGVGNVWEPFSFSLADNDFMTGAMLVRGMTWAEAAWTSIPALSWMQIVIGDPLASVTVIDQPADFDADADVDDDDFQFLENCTTGPAVGGITADCVDADLNGDGFVDMQDFAAFQRCISASYTTLDPNCAD